MNSHVSRGFCQNCGSILPQLRMIGTITCYNCKSEYHPEIYGTMETEYTIYFNTPKTKSIYTNVKTEEQYDGPIIERKCSKCDNNQMTFATLQLRSADEGQTVFYTCTKCKFKETENS